MMLLMHPMQHTGNTVLRPKDENYLASFIIFFWSDTKDSKTKIIINTN